MSAVHPSELSKILPVPRRPVHEYLDPLDLIWIQAAQRMGLEVVRTFHAYADYDGRGRLAIGTTRNLDPDDCIAQIVFHEVCHWLVEGVDSRSKENWGLSNTCLRDLDREYASLRVQASLAQRHGLRRVLANTTDHRAYYDALPDNPLAPGDDPTSTLAMEALMRACLPPFAPALTEALTATRAVALAARPFASPPSLFCLVE